MRGHRGRNIFISLLFIIGFIVLAQSNVGLSQFGINIPNDFKISNILDIGKEEVHNEDKAEAEDGVTEADKRAMKDETTTDTSYSKSADRKEIDRLLSSVDTDNVGYDGYDRDNWMKPVETFKGGKRLRDYSLSISNHNISENGNFKFKDPYTEDIVEGAKILDYDHIIPIGYASTQVGGDWSNKQKHKLAYDLTNGVNTHQAENRGKGADGPSDYMPPENKEEYAYSWLIVANKYDIPIREADMDVIEDTLEGVKEVESINYYK